MRLHKLSLKDKPLFDKYLGLDKHELSVYAFANIFIWKALYAIEWAIIDGCLCVFFKDNIGCFLYLEPLGKKNPEVISKAFALMDTCNKNREISRIENIEEGSNSFYRSLGYCVRKKPPEYLCSRKEMVDLRGDKFKSKRASYNGFVKHYDFESLPFSGKHAAECKKLYLRWMKERKMHNDDPIYQGMLDDSLTSLAQALDHFSALGLVGKIVKVDKKIRGFTLGYSLDDKTFCVLYEITDLSVRGLSQFIFREFCRSQEGFSHINIMDDSGLENLKRVKLSYHPVRIITAYTASRDTLSANQGTPF